MTPKPKTLREFLGVWIGSTISPLFALGSVARHGRVLHPNGLCFKADVSPARALHPRFEDLANALSGAAVARLSAGLWYREHRLLPDLLGFAIRFHASEPYDLPGQNAQDLLLATSSGLLTLPLDLFRTDQSSFFANRYYGFSPFDVGEHRAAKLRIQPNPVNVPGWNRYRRLQRTVEKREASFLLEVLAKDVSPQWQPLVEIHLTEQVRHDEEKLHFWPFRDGQGIQPRGFVHYLRPAPYLFSQAVRDQLIAQEEERVAQARSQAEQPHWPADHRAPVIKLVPRNKRSGTPRH